MSDDLEKKYDDLLFGIRRSIRYHSRRQNFYEGFHQTVLTLALIFSSATIVAFGAQVFNDLPLGVKLLPPVVVTLLATIDMVIGSVRKVWLHADFVRKFTDLEKELKFSQNEVPNKEMINNVTNKRLDIEMIEPPVLKVLDTICHNELLRAMGYEEESQIKIGCLQRYFAHFFDWNEHSLYTKRV